MDADRVIEPAASASKRAACEGLGCADAISGHVSKPIDAQKLIDAIREIRL